VLPVRGLLRRTRAWCPRCYADALDERRPLQDHLLWTIQAVTRCLLHDAPLVDRCPASGCTAPQRVLAWDAHPGYCTRCHAWLGVHPSEPAQGSAADDPSASWDRWVAHAVGDILAAGPSLVLPPTRDVLTVAFQPQEEMSTKRHTRQVAHRTAERSKTVYSWKSGQRIPSLPALLRTCARLGLSPVQVLTGEGRVTVTSARGVGATAVVPPPRPHPGYTYTRFDTERVRVVLQEVVDRADDPPPSMSAVAKRLNRHHADLQARFPDLCGAISARYSVSDKELESKGGVNAHGTSRLSETLSESLYLAYRRDRGQRMRRDGCAQIRAATIAVHAQGVYPTEERVCAFLENPSAIRQAGGHAAWRATLRGLGYAGS